MPYILANKSEYYGGKTEISPAMDELGDVLVFATKREALSEESKWASGYDGIAYWNVLSHNQSAGYRAYPVWVSSDKRKWPSWAK